MRRRPLESTRTDTHFPYPTLFRSCRTAHYPFVVGKSEVAGGKRKTDRLRLSGSEMHALIAFQRADRRFRPARRRQIELSDLIPRPLAGVAHRPAHGLARPRREPGIPDLQIGLGESRQSGVAGKRVT